MKDLDFDELDRAVSSLMSDKTTPPASEPTSPAPVTPAPSPLGESTSSDPVIAVPPTPRPAPPAARRGGRFMDVVPAARKPKETTSSVSREGVSMQPLAPIDTPPAPEKPSSVSRDTPEEIEKPTVSTGATTDWPDPLELAASKEKAVLAPEEKVFETPGSVSPSSDYSGEPKIESVSTEPAVPTKETIPTEEPLSSPFLPDTKVEKRPLGGVALASTGGELMVEDENAQLPALPKDVEPALPEELHGDVVSIAADNSTTDPTKHEEQAADAHPDSTKQEVAKVAHKKPSVTVAEAVVPSGPASIPQQYKEEPSSGDQKNGAIYDTDSYHQPLSHPAKKKSGWGWVLWILIILLVGAGGGAALYFLGIF